MLQRSGRRSGSSSSFQVAAKGIETIAVVSVNDAFVGCYYGYTARGGPVGVGRNTAKSMVVNMVLVSVLGLLAQQAFWGGFPNAPVAN
jgi:ABC-type transporter Mla maintaining outer membrane lipid asymmetry permease subunit MlaE